jgi:adenosine deaminase
MDLNKREAVTVPGGTDLKTLPKALLHEHLDGGLRPQTLLDLCRARGVQVPAADADSLARWMQANANSGSLERYLKGFAITIAAMATEAACERVAFEAAEDALADGCVLAEFRLAPLLWEPHGLSGEAVIEAILAGLARSRLRCGLIVCGMRTDNTADTIRSAHLAVRYRDAGVIGFDLAGAERYFPPSDHAESMEIARDGGLGLTCHAGESDSGDRVLEAAGLGPRASATASTSCVARRPPRRASGSRSPAAWGCTSRSARAATCTRAPCRRSRSIRSGTCSFPGCRCRARPTTA